MYLRGRDDTSLSVHRPGLARRAQTTKIFVMLFIVYNIDNSRTVPLLSMFITVLFFWGGMVNALSFNLKKVKLAETNI